MGDTKNNHLLSGWYLCMGCTILNTAAWAESAHHLHLTRSSASTPSPALTAEKFPGDGATIVGVPPAAVALDTPTDRAGVTAPTGDRQGSPAAMPPPPPPPPEPSRPSLLISGSPPSGPSLSVEPTVEAAAGSISMMLMVEVLLLKNWRGLVGENSPTWPTSGTRLLGLLHIPICGERRAPWIVRGDKGERVMSKRKAETRIDFFFGGVVRARQPFAKNHNEAACGYV